MYDIKCDTHTHTLYSRHAYSTIKENVEAASEVGLELLVSTDHFSGMQWTDYKNSKNYQYLFTSPMTWPDVWMGVRLLSGCEADIVGLNGELFGQDISVTESIVGDPFKVPTTLYEHTTKNMDYVIASIHGKSFTKDATRNQMTDMYIKALQQEKVLILGHMGRSGLDVDFKAIAEAAKSMNKLLEVNEHSFDFGEKKTDSITKRRCRELLEICADIGCHVSIATDAHISTLIGHFDETKKLLEEVHFPEGLIASLNKKTFLEALKASGIKN
ncbi:PHP domain-containing protein [Oribacterium sp. WCC10]|uniref:PHP domain-containing protein n=1 Tax=Oribacterium sp. WCC10 TaxID=1855343 RepID=UPI0008E4D7F8|nr:PHP domain-containing protein [Oribacterium sp. WCC10]SFG13518.1 putative hydrolase [Oribacterium sp. WCC10]